jgi:alpha-methylacyl-CoA racemase
MMRRTNLPGRLQGGSTTADDAASPAPGAAPAVAPGLMEIGLIKPLDGLTVVEFAGLGPAPFAAMLLADMGAHVTRVGRVGDTGGDGTFIERGRDVRGLDLKSEAGRQAALDILTSADVLIEGFRPGKMEALGLGPDDVAAVNPRIVYGRMTGWGQEGPMAHLAGHDLNYLGMTGLLSLMGHPDREPVPPLNLVSDFGGGGMYLAFGIVSALMRVHQTGEGMVVDAAMVHGTTHLSTFVHGSMARGKWSGGRGANMLDGGAPFYRVYRTADDRFMAVGPLEPAFYAAFIETVDAEPEFLRSQWDREAWPAMAVRLEEIFATRTQAEWVAAFEGVDACVTPVLSMDEARAHPQLSDCFMCADGVVQPSPAPRFQPLRSAR